MTIDEQRSTLTPKTTDPRLGLAPVATGEVVDEAGMAELFGIPVETVQAILAGEVPVPEHLRKVWPRATEVRQLVWRREDAEAAAERLHAAEEARVQAERAAAEEERRRLLEQEERERLDYRFERRAALRATLAGDGEPDEPDAETRVQVEPAARPSLLERLRAFIGSFIGAKAPSGEVDPEVVLAAAPEEPTVVAPTVPVAVSPETATEGMSVPEWSARQREKRRVEMAELEAEASALDAGDPAELTPKEVRRRRKIAMQLRALEEAARKEEEKRLAAQRKAERKQHNLEVRRSHKERLERWKHDIERWKGDVKAAKAAGLAPPRRPRKPRMDRSKPDPLEIINAVRAFAIMLDNSPGELESLDMMTGEFDGTAIGETFRRIHYRMSEQNATLVEAFAPEKLFPAEVHNMLKVGAATISPGESLRQAVDLLDSANDAKRSLKGEIGEPITVALLSLGALFATAWGVMPSFTTMYTSLDMPIPPISQFVMHMATGVAVVLMAIAGVTLLYTAWWFIWGRKFDAWRTKLDEWSLSVPLMGKANQTQQTHHALKVMSAYLRVGAPEREVINDTASASTNRAITKHLVRVAELMVEGRKTFADVFDTDLLPSMCRALVATGERAGRLTDTIVRLEATYKKEADVESKQAVRQVSRAVSALSALIFMVLITIVTIPPLEMFGSVLNYGQ